MDKAELKLPRHVDYVSPCSSPRRYSKKWAAPCQESAHDGTGPAPPSHISSPTTEPTKLQIATSSTCAAPSLLSDPPRCRPSTDPHPAPMPHPLHPATSDFEFSEETNVTVTSTFTCGSSSQGYRSMVCSVADGSSTPPRPPGQGRECGGCQQPSYPKWPTVKQIIRRQRHLATPMVRHSHVAYPPDYTCLAALLIVFAPIFGIAALCYLLQMRRNYHAHQFDEAWNNSNAALLCLVMGVGFLILTSVTILCVFFLTTTSTASPPLPTTLPTVPTLSSLLIDRKVQRENILDVNLARPNLTLIL